MRADEDGDVIGAPGAGDNGLGLLWINWASWISGFEALLGGDPEKNGGDDATKPLLGFSIPQFPVVRIMSKSSIPAFESEISA